MAYIREVPGGYKIAVSCGYNAEGKQVRQYMTWRPEPGMTPRQIERELQRRAAEFENLVRHGKVSADGNIKFSAFCKLYMETYAEKYLKPKTVDGYRKNLDMVLPGIGHLKLRDIRPAHIAMLYSNLQERGLRRKISATAKAPVGRWLSEQKCGMDKLAKQHGLSGSTLRRVRAGEPVSLENAKKLAEVIGKPFNTLFTVNRDMSPLDAGTIHAVHRTLSAVFSRAVKWGYIGDNPTTHADLPSRAGKQASFLDEPDVQRLLELLQAEPVKWRALVVFDLMSGLRRAEILGLRWCDVDLDRQTLHIRQTWNYTPREGCYTDTPKTAYSERPLHISATAAAILREYREWRDAQREKLGDAWDESDGRVFTGDDGRPIFPDSVTHWFHAFATRTGLPDVHVHSLRHTYASLLLADGTPLINVSRNLGHAQTSTTGNIYAHVIRSAELRADKTFDRYADLVQPGAVTPGKNRHEEPE